MQEVESLSCCFEWYSNNLLGIDAPTEGLTQHVSTYLLQSERAGLLKYETGKT